MPTQHTYTRAQYESVKRQMKRAWAKYFEATENGAETARIILNQLTQSIPRVDGQLQRPAQLPTHITTEFYEMAVALNKQYSCPICFELTSKDTVHMTWCGHILCKDCYQQIKEDGNVAKCPMCRTNI